MNLLYWSKLLAGGSLLVLNAYLMGIVVFGCKQEVGMKGRTFNSIQELTPEKLPYAKANLILQGTVIPTEMQQQLSKNDVKFLLVTHGTAIEVEHFTFDEKGFRFQGVGGEFYEPPIPLLQFPMMVGDDWSWAGKIRTGPIVRDAKAAIVSSGDALNIPGGPFQTLKIRVNLEMNSGTKQPAERKLTFWLAPGKGIVKREFGAISTREPAPEVLDKQQ